MLSHIKVSFLESSPFWFKKCSYRMFKNPAEVPASWNSGICHAGCSLRWLCSFFAPTHYRRCKGIHSSCCLVWFGDLQTAATIPSSVLSVRVLIHCIHIICFWAASVLKTDCGSFTVECHSSLSLYSIFPKIDYNHWFLCFSYTVPPI